jgi:hypothetical protein
MRELGDDVIVILCVFGGFSILLVAVFGIDYLNSQNQRHLFQETYDKSMECRIAYKDRDTRYIDNVCGTIPQIGDFVGK